MRLCIVRHGASVAGDVMDQQRGLTERGMLQAKGAARWLAGQALSTPRLLVSPFQRTQQTAEPISNDLGIALEPCDLLTPDSSAKALVDFLSGLNQDLIIVSHLPLVGHLAALLVDGEQYEQPWSPAECWMLQGDIAAAGCMSVESVWYPMLDGL